jgi:phosphopantothenoylcysteine decarboxylase / phosphopantothenate---cysteine ligase
LGFAAGGPTPVPIDNVRRITNRFRGKLGIRIAEELYMRGADAHLIHGDGALRPPRHIPWTIARTYEDYLRLVQEKVLGGIAKARDCHEKKCYIGIFSAGVADYMPKTEAKGKIPSGQELTLELAPTRKVIDIARQQRPDMHMVTFKYQEGISHEELMQIARSRIQQPHEIVIANRGEEVGPNGEQVAWMVSNTVPPKKLIGKDAIAIAIVDYLEASPHLWREVPKETP